MFLYVYRLVVAFFFFSSRRRHTRCLSDWSSDVCSSDLAAPLGREGQLRVEASLRTFGLDPTVPDVDLDGAVAELPFAAKRRGNLDEVLLNILGSARSESYRRSEERRVGKEGERRCRRRK